MSGHAIKVHALVVSLMKVIMAVAVVLLVSLLLVWPIIFTPEETFNLKFSAVETDEEEIPVMIKPKFHGVDSKKQPYNVNADEAVQEGEDVVFLKVVSGDMTMVDGQWLSLSSDEGRLNLKNKNGKFMGKVNILSDDGFEFNTNVAYVDFASGTAHGDEEVVGQGPPGTINATGFAVTNNGAEVLFSGPVKMVLYPITSF